VNGGEIVAGGAAMPGSYSCWRGRAPDEPRDQSAASKPVRRARRRHPREQMHGLAIDTGDRLAIPDIWEQAPHASGLAPRHWFTPRGGRMVNAHDRVRPSPGAGSCDGGSPPSTR
jgi:hypothetical protein